MDESFDELEVPDNWLVRKRKLDESADSSSLSGEQSELSASSPTKNSFHELTGPNNWLVCKRKRDESTDSSSSTEEQSELSASSPTKTSFFEFLSAAETSSDLYISSGAETFEDISINEPSLFLDEDSFHECEENSKINGHVLATNKQSETHKGEHLQQKLCVEDKDSKVHQEIGSSLHSENTILKGHWEAVQSLLNGPEICANKTYLGVHKENNPNVDIKETLNGCNKMVKCAEPNCLKSETKVFHNAPQYSGEPTSTDRKNRLKSIESVVRDAKLIADIVPDKDFSDIYTMLLEHRDNCNRLDIVTFQLTQTEETLPSGLSSTVDIFEEVRQVALAVPSVSVNEVYTMLEQLPPSCNRVQDVIATILASGIPASGIKSSAHSDIPPANTNDSVELNESFLVNDPLLQDMKTIAKLFPEKDPNEIYALLEANFKAGNRLEKVINEMLQVDNTNLDGTQQSQTVGSGYTMEKTMSSDVPIDILGQDVERMRNIFPDCDPNYLYEKLYSMEDKPNRTDVLAAEMFEKKNYPQLKDLLDKEKEKNEKNRMNKVKHLTMTVEEFLQKFPDPVKTFGDSTKEPSDIYKQHSEILLTNEFPLFKSGYLRKILAKHNWHLYLAYQEASALLLKTPLARRKYGAMFMKKPRTKKVPVPDTVDEYFYHELWFVYNELTVLDFIKQKEEQRKLKIEAAKVSGQLYECCCCYDDECLLESLASCPEGHLFCKTCVVRSTEAAFSEMKTRFPCLTGECDHDIPLSYLQPIIPANLFSKIVRRLQEEEVQQANIPDLVTCPFCPFAAIMPDPHDKVFKCLNPDCLKDSCRLCQEPNHIPLRCHEVEKKTETDMRVYIENNISEAVMRKCHRCGKRFVKDSGCNKMTCVCGATSCYACKATDIDYSHFGNNKKCGNEDADTIHQRDMEDAALKAKNQYLLDHPEAADVELKTDIKDMIESFKAERKHSRFGNFVYFEDDDESDDDIDDYENIDDEY